jgi:hypothetical protein
MLWITRRARIVLLRRVRLRRPIFVLRMSGALLSLRRLLKTEFGKRIRLPDQACKFSERVVTLPGFDRLASVFI